MATTRMLNGIYNQIRSIKNTLQDDKKVEKINWYEKTGVIINAILAFFTLVALLLSYLANETSKNALAYAQEKDAKDNLADSTRNHKLDSTNKAYTDSVIRINRDFANAALKQAKAQIKSGEEIHEQFDISNKPFLQLTRIDIKRLLVGKPIAIDISVDNFGKYPAKIIEGKYLAVTKHNVPDFREAFTQGIGLSSPVNSYIINNNPLHIWIEYPAKNLSITQDYKLKNGEIYLYLFGFFRYQNLTANTRGIYKFLVKIDPVNDFYYYLINENEVDNSRH
jgi:hypothetical protein